MFRAGTQFAYDDESREALVWRRGQRDTEILAAARRVPAVVLHYELVPGVAKTELDEEGYFDYLVEIEYSVDQPGDWKVRTTVHRSRPRRPEYAGGFRFVATS